MHFLILLNEVWLCSVLEVSRDLCSMKGRKMAYRKKSATWFGSMALLALLSACGGGGGGGAPVAEPPIIQPPITQPPAEQPAPTLQLLRTTPAADDSGVDLTATFAATFSAPIDADTLNTQSVVLTPTECETRACNNQEFTAFDMALSLERLTLKPTKPLNLLTRYTVKFDDTIKSSDGLSFAGAAKAFSTRDGQWQASRVIGTQTDALLVAPQVASNDDGRTFAVWHEAPNSSGLPSVRASRYDARTGAWDAPVQIGNDANPTVKPSMAVDAAGNALVLWSQNMANGSLQIHANRYDARLNQWSANANEIDAGTGFSSAPSVVFDANGNALAVWEKRISTGAFFEVWANRYDASTNQWGIATVIQSKDLNSPVLADPHVAFDRNGDAVAVWQQFDGVRINVVSKRYSAQTGAWDALAVVINTDSHQGSATESQLAIDGQNNAYVVWSQNDGVRLNIWASRSDAKTRVWAPPQLVDETNNLGDAFSPQVITDSKANVVVVWAQVDGGVLRIWANRFIERLGAWGQAQRISSDLGIEAKLPRVRADKAGNLMVVWRQEDGAGASISASRFNALTNTWAEPRSISSQRPLDDGFSGPEIAIDTTGKLVAVWPQSQDNGITSAIAANSFR
jgi:hypothetical protein